MSNKSEVRCQHIMESGRRCGTPPMKGKPFCYYHGRLHSNHVLPGHRLYQLPNLDNAHGIQIAITQLASSIAKGLIDHKEAGKLAYSIQLAQTSLKRFTEEVVPPEDVETEFTEGMAEALHVDDDSEIRVSGETNFGEPGTCPDTPSGTNETPRDYRDHPLAHVEGLRPIDAPPLLPTEKPRWVPIVPQESEFLCNNLPEDERRATARQKFCLRRLRLQLALHGEPNPSTQQLIEAVAKVEEEEKNSIKNMDELNPLPSSAKPAWRSKSMTA